jgi:hypothetical protein
MNASRMTFGEHLMQFALSIDFIESNCYDLVQQLIARYLKQQLGATQVGLFEGHVVSNQPGMLTVWSEPTLRVSECLKDTQGQYARQLGLALGDVRNLWVVSRKDEPLSPSNSGVDYWEEGRPSKKLPPFSVSAAGSSCRTAIYMTTRDAGDRPNGVLLVELANPVRPTQTLRNEMQLLADSVGLLHATDASTREQRDGTNRAIDRLGDLVRQLELDTGPRPLLFFASSHRADTEVLKAIHDVLKEFDDHVFVQHWGDMHQPGNINAQLVDKIRRAQYGICYLSEPAEPAASEEKGPRFRDNPNVLVEAGMLHMVTNTGTGTTTGWIPIRELDSPAVPFDLSNERQVIVVRDDAGAFQKPQFKDDLREKLAALFNVRTAEPQDDD